MGQKLPLSLAWQQLLHNGESSLQCWTLEDPQPEHLRQEPHTHPAFPARTSLMLIGRQFEWNISRHSMQVFLSPELSELAALSGPPQTLHRTQREQTQPASALSDCGMSSSGRQNGWKGSQQEAQYNILLSPMEPQMKQRSLFGRDSDVMIPVPCI